MCPRRGRDGRAGTFRSELMRARTHGPHHRSPSKNYRAWWVGKNQRFWFFEPVEDSGRRMGVRKRKMTVSAQTLSAFMHSREVSALCFHSFLITVQYSLDQPNPSKIAAVAERAIKIILRCRRAGTVDL